MIMSSFGTRVTPPRLLVSPYRPKCCRHWSSSRCFIITENARPERGGEKVSVLQPIADFGCMKDKELKLEDVEVPASVPHTLGGASDTI